MGKYNEIKIKSENRLNYLFEVFRRINRYALQGNDTKEILKFTCDQFSKIAKNTVCAIFQKDINSYTRIIKADNFVKSPSNETLLNDLENTLNNQNFNVTADNDNAIIIKDDNQNPYISVLIPMQLNQETVGVIVLCSTAPLSFEVEEKNLLQKIANHIAFVQNKFKSKNSMKVNKQLYNLLVENANDFVLLHDLDGNIIFFNKSGRKLTGYSASDLSNKTVKDLIAPQYLEDLEKRRDKRLNGEDTQKTYEIEIICKSGEKIPVEIVSTPNVMNGDITGILIIGRNITELKQVNRKLLRSKKILERTQKIAKIGSWEHDLETNEINWSKEIYRIFGVEFETFIPNYQSFLKLVHPDDRKAVDHAYKKSLEMDFEGYEIEHRIVRNDGEIRHILEKCEHIKDESGKIVSSVGMAKDITEIKEKGQRLRESEEKFRTLSETSPVAILLHRGGKWIYANKAAEQISGYTTTELKNMNFWEMAAPEYREIVQERGQDRAKNEISPSHYEIKIVTKDEEKKWVYLSNNNIFINGKRTVIVTALNITEKKKLEEHLHQSQKLESIGTLAAGVAHDFNNMLAVIKGRTQMALMEFEGDPNASENLSEVLEASNRAAELTKQMLLFSRKEGMNFKPLNLNKTIQDILKMIERIIGEDIEIITNYADNIWPVKADENNINQVIMNIAANARDVMDKGGRLFITTQNMVMEEDRNFEEFKVLSGHYVKLSIQDTGSGIPNDVVDKIFDPFFTTKGRAKGTGMGLSVVYGIIKKHKGYINVDSQLGEGTCFSIYLPSYVHEKVAESEPKIEQNFKMLDGNGENILLVEDDSEVRQTIVDFLKYGGYKLDSAQNGTTALELFSKNIEKYNLVISDVVLPDLNGLDVIKNIKEERSIPCLLISGYPDEIAKIDAEDYYFLQKPFDLKQLLRKIKEIL